MAAKATNKAIKSSNSLAARIPTEIAAVTGIQEGTIFKMQAVEGQIIIKVQKRKRVRLKDFLAKMTKKSRQPTMDWGRPVGQEKIP